MFFKVIIIYPLLLLLLQESLCNNVKTLDQDVGEVIFVNILYRHGERTPIFPYPNDPYKDPSYWPCDWGQLTNAGKLHHYILGSWFRTRYNHLIPGGRYNNKAIYVKSTDVDRTLMSAEANLAGMFPPGLKEKWGGIKWQPIPVHTVPETSDKILAMKAPCKRYDLAFKHAMASPEMVKLNEKYNKLFKYLALHTGEKVNDLTKVEYIYSTLFIEALANYTLPDWTKAIFPQPLAEAAAISFAIPTFTKELKRLRGGPLVKDMLENMFEKAKGNLVRNISVYSAHDTTVGNLLNTMGVFNFMEPPFAASVLMELRRNYKTNEDFVTVLYKNSTGDPHILTIPGCAAACPMRDLKALLSDVIPDDWDSECHSHDLFDLTNGQPYHSLTIFAMVTSTLIVFLILASASLFWNKQKPTHLYKKLKIETL